MDDDHETSHNVPMNQALFTLDDEDGEDFEEEESDLFGRIQASSTTSHGGGLFDGNDIPNSMPTSDPPPMPSDDNKVPDTSFYRVYDDPLRALPHAEEAPSLFHPLANTLSDLSKSATLPWQRRNTEPESEPKPKTENKSNLSHEYGKVAVAHPIMMETNGLFGAKGVYWTYEVRTEINGRVVSVRRRFRNIVALETRLRQNLPGAILPSRPYKFSTQPLEEGHLRQSHDFAKKRATELQNYLNNLLKHPLVAKSSLPDVHLFFTSQDDIGTAWPECSTSTFTRLTAITANLNNKINSGEISTKANSIAMGTDLDDTDEELMTLMETECMRMDQVNIAAPKLQASLTLLNDHGEVGSATGLEISKLCKDITGFDSALAKSLNVLAIALIKNGRRTKLISTQLDEGGILRFEQECRGVRNELAAFDDRKILVNNMYQKQIKANRALVKYEIKESEVVVWGNRDLIQLKDDLTQCDEDAVQAMKEAERVGMVLKQEIVRLAIKRRKEYHQSICTIAKDMKKYHADKINIWNEGLAKCQKEFPNFNSPEELSTEGSF